VPAPDQNVAQLYVQPYRLGVSKKGKTGEDKTLAQKPEFDIDMPEAADVLPPDGVWSEIPADILYGNKSAN
jgi:hypothetical protein